MEEMQGDQLLEILSRIADSTGRINEALEVINATLCDMENSNEQRAIAALATLLEHVGTSQIDGYLQAAAKVFEAITNGDYDTQG